MQSILLFSLVIATGLLLGRFRVKGVSLGFTWILFVGIIVSHFGFHPDPTVNGFMKDFGLILFVFSIGLQVGPGFFHSFKKGGLALNLMAVVLVLLAVAVTLVIHWVTGESLETLCGVMSGAVTNTPGLGAAQQTVQDVMAQGGVSAGEIADVTGQMASGYAVAYPIGVVGVIAALILLKALFRVDIPAETARVDKEDAESVSSARRMHCRVENPGLFGRRIREIRGECTGRFIVSRMLRDGVISVPNADTELRQGDTLLIVTSQDCVDELRQIFGQEVPMHQSDWEKMDGKLIVRRVTVTKNSLTGKKLSDLQIRDHFNVSVTRVGRSGVELVARPNLVLQVGDNLQVVGTEEDIALVAKMVGNKPDVLTNPNIVPIFFGIAAGVIFGSLPIHFPGIPQPVKLGLAGGPLIIAILLGYFGPKWHITTYTTLSANKMIREIGLAFFMAAVGLGAGGNFVSAIVGGGYRWILYGALITLIPVIATALVARYALKMDFFRICGLVSGGTTDAAVLSFAQGAYGSDHAAVNYATVYPLSMFMRVLVAQLLVLFALS